MATFKGANVTIEICYGSENAALGEFFRFMEKRLRSKRHINALLAANIETIQALEDRLETINLLRGIGEKSAAELIESYEAYKLSKMTPDQRLEAEMQNWAMTAAVQTIPFDLGDRVFFFDRLSQVVEGEVRRVIADWRYRDADSYRHGTKYLEYHYYVWVPSQRCLSEFHRQNLFRSIKDAMKSVKVVHFDKQ